MCKQLEQFKKKGLAKNWLLKLLMYVSTSFLLTIVLSCTKTGNIQFNSQNASSFLQQNSENLDLIVSTYLNQSSIRTIIRRDKSKFWFFIFDNTIKYTIILDSFKIFNFSFNAIDINDELSFWKKDFQLIKDNKNREISLKRFLNENQIKENVLSEIAELMIGFNLNLITKSEKNFYVKLNFEVFEGLIYFSDSVEAGGIESSTKLEKITNNWYYFKEIY